MPWITFGTLTSPQPANQTLDPMFANVAALGSIPCTATGTNAIALAPGPNTPPITSYPDLQPSFVFVAQSTSTGAVTINVNGVGARNAYKWNGANIFNEDGFTFSTSTPCGANDIIAGGIYRATPLLALNAGAGGFVVDAVGVNNAVFTINYVIDNGGNPITTGSKGFLFVPFSAGISTWNVIADQTGSIAIDILRGNGVVPSSSIVGAGTKPGLSSQQLVGNTAPSGWTSTALVSDDILGFSVSSAATVTRVTLGLTCLKI